MASQPQQPVFDTLTATTEKERIAPEKKLSVVVTTAELDEFIEPTAEEAASLRKVAGHVPPVAYILCAVEFAERASYYGCSQVFSNFLQFPLPAGGNGAGATPVGTQETPGALNQGLVTSSAISNLFTFLAYTVPILGGWIADTRLGRYKTIFIGVLICGVAHIIMVVGAVPSVLQAGNGLPPFVVSLIILAFGAGLFKSNIAPTILDQYPHQKQFVSTLPSGERVIVDPEVTAQRMMLTFYALINVGAFFGLATTYAEKDVGYWLAYLLPGVLYFLCPLVLLYAYKKTVKRPPQGSVVGDCFRVVGTAIKRNGIKGFGRAGYLEAAKPSVLTAGGGELPAKVTWDDSFVEDVGRTLEACQIFLFFPVYNLNDGGIGNIQTSQGSAMITNGTPNDLLSNFNPLAIIVAVPILNYGIYPLLRKHNVSFGRISRITFGFVLAALSSAIGAILQWQVYQTSPCGYYATSCDIGDGVSALSIWWQIPLYTLGALSEVFCNVTAYEIAYSRSPKNMKGLVMALFLFTNALSSALSEAVVAVLVDPFLIWPFAATSVAGFLLAIWFYFAYRHLDNDVFIVNADDPSVVDAGHSNSVRPRGIDVEDQVGDKAAESSTTIHTQPNSSSSLDEKI